MGQTFIQPDFTAQLNTAYKTNIDSSMAVVGQQAAMFAPHEQVTPNMTIKIDEGRQYSGRLLNVIAAQNTSPAIVAPSSLPRIDRVTIDRVTGNFGVTTGAENATPVAPAVLVGHCPIAQIFLNPGQTVIVNADITDERDFTLFGLRTGLHQKHTSNYTSTPNDNQMLLEFNLATPLEFALAAASVLREGWFVYVHNSGNGVLTINPDGAELIDNESTLTLNRDESLIIFCSAVAGVEFWTVGRSGISDMPEAHINGLNLSNDAGDDEHDILVTPGEARSTNDVANLILTVAQTKRIDASWTTGDNGGGLSSTPHPVLASTWYHMFIFTISGLVEVGFDNSVTGANLASDHSAVNLRRIGSVLTDGPKNIIQFRSREIEGGALEFWWETSIIDGADILSSTAGNVELSTPLGYQVEAFCTAHMDDTGTAFARYYPQFATDETVARANAMIRNEVGGTHGNVSFRVQTDTASLIRHRADSTPDSDDLSTYGWIDPRR